jgi:hypothetical protein
MKKKKTKPKYSLTQVSPLPPAVIEFYTKRLLEEERVVIKKKPNVKQLDI